jgi:hypothetical protein
MQVHIFRRRCGRFDNLIARDAYRGLFKVQRLPKSNFPLRYNVAPTDQIPIVRIDPRDGEREVVMARWGLIPFWMKEKPKAPHINARAETVHKLPLFREAFAKRRCLIPASAHQRPGLRRGRRQEPSPGSLNRAGRMKPLRLPNHAAIVSAHVRELDDKIATWSATRDRRRQLLLKAIALAFSQSCAVRRPSRAGGKYAAIVKPPPSFAP